MLLISSEARNLLTAVSHEKYYHNFGKKNQCHTSQVTTLHWDVLSSLTKYDLNQASAIPLMPYWWSFQSNALWSAVSNISCKSTKITLVKFFSSIPFSMLSIGFMMECIVETLITCCWTFRKIRALLYLI